MDIGLGNKLIAICISYRQVIRKYFHKTINFSRSSSSCMYSNEKHHCLMTWDWHSIVNYLSPETLWNKIRREKNSDRGRVLAHTSCRSYMMIGQHYFSLMSSYSRCFSGDPASCICSFRWLNIAYNTLGKCEWINIKNEWLSLSTTLSLWPPFALVDFPGVNV